MPQGDPSRRIRKSVMRDIAAAFHLLIFVLVKRMLTFLPYHTIWYSCLTSTDAGQEATHTFDIEHQQTHRYYFRMLMQALHRPWKKWLHVATASKELLKRWLRLALQQRTSTQVSIGSRSLPDLRHAASRQDLVEETLRRLIRFVDKPSSHHDYREHQVCDNEPHPLGCDQLFGHIDEANESEVGLTNGLQNPTAFLQVLSSVKAHLRKHEEAEEPLAKAIMYLSGVADDMFRSIRQELNNTTLSNTDRVELESALVHAAHMLQPRLGIHTGQVQFDCNALQVLATAHLPRAIGSLLLGLGAVLQSILCMKRPVVVITSDQGLVPDILSNADEVGSALELQRVILGSHFTSWTVFMTGHSEDIQAMLQPEELQITLQYCLEQRPGSISGVIMLTCKSEALTSLASEICATGLDFVIYWDTDLLPEVAHSYASRFMHLYLRGPVDAHTSHVRTCRMLEEEGIVKFGVDPDDRSMVGESSGQILAEGIAGSGRPLAGGIPCILPARSSQRMSKNAACRKWYVPVLLAFLALLLGAFTHHRFIFNFRDHLNCSRTNVAGYIIADQGCIGSKLRKMVSASHWERCGSEILDAHVKFQAANQRQGEINRITSTCNKRYRKNNYRVPPYADWEDYRNFYKYILNLVPRKPLAYAQGNLTFRCSRGRSPSPRTKHADYLEIKDAEESERILIESRLVREQFFLPPCDVSEGHCSFRYFLNEQKVRAMFNGELPIPDGPIWLALRTITTRKDRIRTEPDKLFYRVVDGSWPAYGSTIFSFPQQNDRSKPFAVQAFSTCR